MNNIPVIKPEWLEGIAMTSEQKAKWLSALRSGEYQQCKYGLCEDISPLHHPKIVPGYCCLGVYCSAVMAMDDDDLWNKSELCDVGLPHVLGGWSAPDFDAEKINTWTSIQSVLAGLNDSGCNFEEIADFIEANIPACDERAAP